MRSPSPLRLSPELSLLASAAARACGLAAAAPPPDPGAPLDWSRFVHLTEEHALGPLLGAHPEVLKGTSPPADLATWLASQRVRASHDAAARTHHMQRVLRLVGSDAVVLKGCAVAETLYTDVGQRHMSDLDLLLGSREQALAASRALCEVGFQAVRARSPRHLPALVDRVAEVTVELHTMLTTPPLPKDVLATLIATAQPRLVLGLPTRVLSPAGRLLHHAIHAMDGPVATPLLRNLLEVALMARRLGAPDTAELRELTREPQLRARVARGTWLAASLFDCPPLLPAPPRGVLDLIARRRLEWVAGEEGLWPRFREHVASQAAERIYQRVGLRGARGALEAVAFACRDAVDNRRDHRTLEGTRLIRRPELVATPFGDARILHDPETGEVHVLGELAVRAWELADGQLTGAALISALVATGIEAGEARRLVEELVEADLARTLRHHQRARKMFVTRPGRPARA